VIGRVDWSVGGRVVWCFDGLSFGVWASVLVIGRVDCPVGGRVVWCFDGLIFGAYMRGNFDGWASRLSGQWASVLLGCTAPHEIPLRSAICTATVGRTAGQAGSVTCRRKPLHCNAFQTHLRKSNSWTQCISNYVPSK
jgi:hypothetical protein